MESKKGHKVEDYRQTRGKNDEGKKQEVTVGEQGASRYIVHIETPWMTHETMGKLGEKDDGGY